MKVIVHGTADGGPAPPPLRNPDTLAQAVHEACLADTVYRSRAAEFIRANPGATGIDYLHALTKPHRDAGTTPTTFANVASYAAWALTLPAPPVEWKETPG
jgi:hypothetical protein